MKLDCKLLEILFVVNILYHKNIKFDTGYPEYTLMYNLVAIDMVNEIHNQLTNETNNEINVRY